MKKSSSNLIWLLITALLVGLVVIPGAYGFLREKVFPVERVIQHNSLSKEHLNVKLRGINAPDTNLNQLLGQKAIFLNFWGTWCAPCRKEWPSIEKLYGLKRDKINFVLIAMQDEEPAVRKFLAENHYTAPVYIAESPLEESLLPKVFPTTYLLSKDGFILLKDDATRDWASPENLNFIGKVIP